MGREGSYASFVTPKTFVHFPNGGLCCQFDGWCRSSWTPTACTTQMERTFVSNSAVQVHFIPSILLTSFVSLYVFISNQAGGPSTACTGREVSKSSGFYKGCEFGRTGNPRWEQGMWQHSISDIILQYGKVKVACKIQVETWTVSNFSNKLSCLKY